MHRVLYLIVRASDKEDAIETAQETFEDELKNDDRTTYDYCKLMEAGHEVAGSDRWTGFEDEPIAAPISAEQAQDWVNKGLEDTKRHFARSLYSFLANAQQTLEDSVETAPSALDKMVEYARENSSEKPSDGGDELLEQLPRSIDALYDGGDLHHRYNAANLREENRMQAHVFDCYTYTHPSPADGSYRLENVRELLSKQPDDAWVVPLDAHF